MSAASRNGAGNPPGGSGDAPRGVPAGRRAGVPAGRSGAAHRTGGPDRRPGGPAARVWRWLAGRSDEQVFAACLAGIALAVGLFLVVPLVPLFGPIHQVPTQLDYNVVGKPEGGVTGFWLLAMGSFGCAVWQWRRGRRPSGRLLVAGAIMLTLVSLLVPPFASEDVYAYSFYGKVQSTYGVNPYLSFPEQYSFDSWYHLWPWRLVGPVYGPPFLLLLRGVAALAGPSLLAFVVAMKLLLVAAELLAVWLLACATAGPRGPRAPGATAAGDPRAPGAGGTGDLQLRGAVGTGDPDDAGTGDPDAGTGDQGDPRWPVLLIAWNPMVMQAVAMSAHVDALLLLAVAGAVLAHRRGHRLVAFLLLVLTFLFKMYMGPVAALYALWLAFAGAPRAGSLGRRLAHVAGLGALGAAVTALTYLPYASAGTKLFSSALDVSGHFSTGSPPNLVRRALAAVLPAFGVVDTTAAAVSDQVARLGAVAAILVAFALVARKVVRATDPWPPIATYFLAYLLLTPWVFYWHELPLLGFVAVIPWGVTSLVAVVLSMTLVPLAPRPPRAGVSMGGPTAARELGNTVAGLAERYGAAFVALWLGLARRRRAAALPPGAGEPGPAAPARVTSTR
ncbi:MAG TPA: hypothetical protein VG276_23840 [Actinomycetes bacterium]|nr:hypothetical protein [Actinomycetes bacterium]